MPRRPSGPCTFPGCKHKATQGARCATHQRQSDKPRRDGWVYADRRYKPWRKAVMRRDPMCRGYPQPCRNPSTQADHIVPIVDGGPPFDPANGQGLCADCHWRKTRDDRHARRPQGVG